LRLVALVVIALAVTVVCTADPTSAQHADGAKATLTLTARSHGHPQPTLLGTVGVAAGLIAASAWVASVLFVPVEVRRRSVSPIRRRGPPFMLG
jgi:hypothetical protein